jgi:hypothetical protein
MHPPQLLREDKVACEQPGWNMHNDLIRIINNGLLAHYGRLDRRPFDLHQSRMRARIVFFAGPLRDAHAVASRLHGFLENSGELDSLTMPVLAHVEPAPCFLSTTLWQHLA